MPNFFTDNADLMFQFENLNIEVQEVASRGTFGKRTSRIRYCSTVIQQGTLYVDRSPFDLLEIRSKYLDAKR